MQKFNVLAGALLTLMLGIVSTARAQLTERTWLNVCGGGSFTTCASVQLAVSGSQVTIHVWNLSGFSGSSAGAVFTGIGFFNIGTAAVTSRTMTVISGPARPGGTPTAWVLDNLGPINQIGGGVQLDIVATTGTSDVNNSIANACPISSPPESPLPGGGNQLWQNPCAIPASSLTSGWVTIQFTLASGTWYLTTTELLVKAQNGPNGLSTTCVTGVGGNCSVVPEPISMALLGTGLLGLGGVKLVRRRREAEEHA